MKCHYIYDKKAGKILIPGCWSVAHSNDMRRCTCRNEYPQTEAQFERNIFNERMKAKDEEISNLKKQVSDLEKYVFSLNRIIKRVNNKL